MLALSPLLLAIAVLVRLCLGPPVFFRQPRIGYLERPFTLIKFRTMRSASGPDGRQLPDDARLTRLGRFLRNTSLDELPELLKVLSGEMSLVGPRPLLPEYLPLYSERQRLRHRVRPGLTGWAQVHGRNAIDWDAKLELDAWYVENRSLALDVRILLVTVYQVLSCRGISHGEHATMPPFTGGR